MFDETLRVILSLPEMEPIEALPVALDALFVRLRQDATASNAWTIEESRIPIRRLAS